MWFKNLRTRVLNAYINWHNDRLEKKKRKWTCNTTFGGSSPLGKCNQETAISRASKYGPVIFVDTEVAIVFVSGTPSFSGENE